MRISAKDFPRRTLYEIIKQAIREGKLFELIFSEEGKRLRMRTVRNEEEFKEMVRKALKEVEL